MVESSVALRIPLDGECGENCQSVVVEDEFFVAAREIAVDELDRLHARGEPVGSFTDLAHRALAEAARRQRRRLSKERFRNYSGAIVEYLREISARRRR